MNNKIIEELVAKIEEYQIAKGNNPTAIIMNDKDAKGLFDSVKVGGTIVNYRYISDIKFKNIKIYRSIDIDRGKFEIL